MTEPTLAKTIEKITEDFGIGKFSDEAVTATAAARQAEAEGAENAHVAA